MKFLKNIYKAFTVLLGFIWGIVEFVLGVVPDGKEPQKDDSLDRIYDPAFWDRPENINNPTHIDELEDDYGRHY